MKNNNTVPQKSWFDRNWKWFIPTGCLGLIVVVAIFAVCIFFGITSAMESSDVYKHSLEVARKNKTVIEKIGNKIEPDGINSGNISTSNNSGNAKLDISIKGSDGTGLIHVEAVKENNIWTYNVMNFYPNKSNEPIDLLVHKP